MSSTFFERIDLLAERVGTGPLKAKVVVDQVYAHYQHEGTDFAHPHGGQAHFLRDGLYGNMDKSMEHLAGGAITEGGSEIREHMADVAEDISEQVFVRAPVEHGNLRNSGHPTVTDDGATIYDRAPHVGRLSEAELRSEHERAHRAKLGHESRAQHRGRHAE